MKAPYKYTTSEGRGKGISYAGVVRLSDMIKEFKALNNPDAQAAFVNSWLALWASDIERTWPFVCQVLQWIETEKLFSEPRVFGDGQTFPDFKSFFEKRIKKPFSLWYELEQTYRFVTRFAPEMIEATFGEARAAAAKYAQEVAERSQATQRPAHRPKKPAADLIELANRPEESTYNNKSDVRSYRPNEGNRVEKAERRLRKDRPDLHARVLAGELSWNAAAIEAGFRKKPMRKKLTALDRVKKLLPKLSDEERTELIKILQVTHGFAK
jgi:hypothetical protein